MLQRGAGRIGIDKMRERVAQAEPRRRRIHQGDVRPIPTPEEAIAELGASPGPPSAELGDWPRYFAGTPERVRDQLIDMAGVLHVDELMIVTVVHDHRARMRSYELLAEAFNLVPRAA